VINLKTAKTLGLDVSPGLAASADEIVEHLTRLVFISGSRGQFVVLFLVSLALLALALIAALLACRAVCML
jgi:hypothetical protein